MLRILKRLPWVATTGVIVAVLTFARAVPVLAHGDEVSVNPQQAKHGDTITVSGQALPADQALTIVLVGTGSEVMLGQAKTDSQGKFSVQFTVPEEASPGKYRLEVRGGDEVVTLDFSVLAEGETPSAGTQVVFKRSMSETVVIAIIALALVAAGTVLVLAARRESRT